MPRRLRLLFAVPLLVLFGGACRETTRPQPVHPLTGVWFPSETPQPPSPVNFFEMELRVIGDSVAGVGRWGDLPGPRGDVTVHGTVIGSAVTLDIAFSSDVPTFAARQPQRFVGTLVAPAAGWGSIAELRGILYETDTAREFSYVRGMKID